MCPLNMEDYPYCLAIAKKDKLAIGIIDDDQRLHIRAIPCQDQVCHISYQEQTRTFATCSVKFTQPDREEHFVHLINDEAFDITSTYPLEEDECSFSIVSCSFSDDNNVYYCVGTGYLVEGFEPSGGRILVFLVEDGELKLIEEMETAGAVYSVNAFNGKLLAAFNRKIQLYKWTSNAKPGIQKLQMECVHSGPLITRHVQTCGDLIVVGDLMKSIILLMFKNEEGAIVERARDRNENWMSAVELLEDDIYLGADISNNLLTVRNNSEGASDAECSSLEVVGEYHIGESVKRFCKCSLVRNSDIPTVLFGTKDGSIGAIASLSDYSQPSSSS